MGKPPQLTQIAPGVHVWAPDGTDTWGLANCGLIVSGHRAALVDTPYALDLTDAFLAAARGVAGPGVRLDTVLMTHANGDHSWGNQLLPGAEIISTRETLEHQCFEPTPQQLHAATHDTDPDQPLGWYFRRHFGRFDFSGITVVPPTRTFTGRLDLAIGDVRVELHHVGPAHTVGDMVAHLPAERVVFAGDVMFAGDHPCHWAGPLSRVADACRRVLALEPELVVPGHGPVVGPEELRGHIAYLDDLSARAHELHAEGLTATAAAERLIREDRYPGLGLPERLAITLASEFRAIEGDTSRPDLLGLVETAARIAWERDQPGAAATVPAG